MSQAADSGVAVTRRHAPSKAEVAEQLGAARRRMLDLLAPLDDDDLCRQHSELMSPLVWDLAHCAHFEELWLVRALGGAPSADRRLDDLYNAFAHERSERAALELLTPAEALRFGEDVRGRSLELLDRVQLDGDRLLDGAFVYGMLVQHEHQHVETMLQTLQLRDAPYPLDEPAPRSGHVSEPAEMHVDGGRFLMGTDDEPWAYDNERPAHRVDVAPFRIDTVPVTNAAYAAFVDAGGYEDERLWHPAGWAFRAEQGLEHPGFWRREDGGWSRRRFGHREPLPPDEPVQHVCWYEADAYARWAGRRLPTEAEWERAASWADGDQQRWPWGDADPTAGHANLAGTRYAPAAVGAYPDGVSADGVEQLVGDVWEWTASDFTAYPGFEAFPYAEYSEVFFGSGYKVLRGGAWATHPLAMRSTFRNWDFPIRRQLFAGFRCARDA